MDMWGVVPSENRQFKVAVKQVETLPSGHLLYAMATCHSLTVIDNQISGDPLDIKVFINIYFTLVYMSAYINHLCRCNNLLIDNSVYPDPGTILKKIL